MMQASHSTDSSNGHHTATPLPEAPASCTLKAMYRGYELLFTLRDHSGAHLLQKVDAAINALEQMGATPAPARGTKSGGKAKARYIALGELCPVHGVELRRGQYSYYCPRKGDDGEWCPVRTRSLSG